MSLLLVPLPLPSYNVKERKRKGSERSLMCVREFVAHNNRQFGRSDQQLHTKLDKENIAAFAVTQ